jgi:quercetin 2,3-dioxygenase
MLTNTEAKIYLADQRGCSQNERYRSYHTFSFGTYLNENRKPFGALHAFNDDTLKGGNTVKHQVQEDTAILLLPIVGAVRYSHNGVHRLLEAGQCHIFFVSKKSEFELSNPYENELINFLQIWFTIPTLHNDHHCEFEFDLNTSKNKLIPFISSLQEKQHLNMLGYIGKFDGREEGTYLREYADSGVFIFVIEGAFEVQNRLLHPRDGLSLRNVNKIEFEALSNEAIILLLEPRLTIND